MSERAESELEQQITVDPELHSLIPSLLPDEMQLLEKSLLSEGCRDALVVWRGLLLDGHNRYEICNQHNLSFEIREIGLSDRNAAKLWIIRNQLARRNLTPYQKAELALAMKPLLAAKAKEKQGTRTDLSQNSAESFEAVDTREELAKIAGVSHDTIYKAAVINERADKETKEALRRGETTINKEYKEITQKPHVAQNTGDNEWYTPLRYIDAARKVMGRIDLDPASSIIANEFIKADKFYTIEDSGLYQSWRGCVWMNPPYALSLVRQFSDKLLEELSNIEQAMVLVNNATETIWFQKLLAKADAVCFLRGRIKFLNERGEPANAPLQGQAVLYFGAYLPTFEEVFSEFGQVLKHV